MNEIILVVAEAPEGAFTARTFKTAPIYEYLHKVGKRWDLSSSRVFLFAKSPTEP